MDINALLNQDGDKRPAPPRNSSTPHATTPSSASTNYPSGTPQQQWHPVGHPPLHHSNTFAGSGQSPRGSLHADSPHHHSHSQPPPDPSPRGSRNFSQSSYAPPPLQQHPSIAQSPARLSGQSYYGQPLAPLHDSHARPPLLTQGLSHHSLSRTSSAAISPSSHYQPSPYSAQHSTPHPSGISHYPHASLPSAPSPHARPSTHIYYPSNPLPHHGGPPQPSSATSHRTQDHDMGLTRHRGSASVSPRTVHSQLSRDIPRTGHDLHSPPVTKQVVAEVPTSKGMKNGISHKKAAAKPATKKTKARIKNETAIAEIEDDPMPDAVPVAADEVQSEPKLPRAEEAAKALAEPAANTPAPPRRRFLKERPLFARPAKNPGRFPKQGSWQSQRHATTGLASLSDFNASALPASNAKYTSINDTIPNELITVEVADFLFSNLAQAQIPVEQLEIEAKIGQIIDRNTNDRLNLPIKTDCVLHPGYNVAFESNMNDAQHASLNKFLNTAAETSNEKAAKDPTRRAMVYRHLYETDTFYELSAGEVDKLPSYLQQAIRGQGKKPRLRITHNQKTGEVLAALVKIRVKDMHIYNPKYMFDWRISISIEYSWDGDVAAFLKTNPETASPTRNKNRVSYGHGPYRIDLTQVKLGEDTSVDSATHELEVEIDASAVRREGELVAQAQPNDYMSMVEAFVHNVKLLAKHC